jgi:hypothetical protein
LSPGAAEYLLSIRFGDRDNRMDELSELARQGTLTSEEQADLDSYLHVENLLLSCGRKATRLAAFGSNQGSGTL